MTTEGRERPSRTRDQVGSYEDIVAAAVRSTGLTDFGDNEQEHGLRLVVDDLNSPTAGLTGIGRYQQRGQVKSALVGRLLTQSGLTRHPEHRDVVVERPVFVLGLPRTGTTALHRLLTADPAHQGLEMWLTEFPQPRPPRDTWADNPVYAAIEAASAEYHVANPEFMGLHYQHADTVEECWRLLRQAGTSIGFETLAHLPRYSDWLAGQDWVPAYHWHRRGLQLIGLNDRDRRWVLKNPSHLVALDALMTAYPDALVVVTHRDPVTAIASACSLSAEATAGWSTTFVDDLIGTTQLHLWSRCWRSFAEARTRYPSDQFIDVQYADFVADPLGTTRAVYDRFGLEWTPATGTAVRRVDQESRQGPRRPAHRYRLSDYGLTEAQVHQAFAR